MDADRRMKQSETAATAKGRKEEEEEEEIALAGETIGAVFLSSVRSRF